jgi:hypothetical protein
MNLLAYLKSLLPSFGRERILDDIARMRADLEESLLPILKSTAQHFHNSKKFATPYARGVEAAVQAALPGAKHRQLFPILLSVFEDAAKLLDTLEALVEEGFGKDIEQEAITYRRASLLKFLEVLSFEIDFASDLTLRIITAEGHAVSKEDDLIDSELTARDKKHFEKNYPAWLSGLKTIDTTPGALKTAIMQVPEVLLSEETDEGIRQQFGVGAIDPLKMNFISPSWNPIYHIRAWNAEQDVHRIQKAREEKKLVELRLHDLKARERGEANASLQHQIELVENRLKGINFRIAKYSGELA